MKYFPFKTVLFCIFAIPVFYTMTLVGAEKGLIYFYRDKIEAVLPAEAVSFSDNGFVVGPLVQNCIEKFVKKTPLLEWFKLFPAISIHRNSDEFIYVYRMRKNVGTPAFHGIYKTVLEGGKEDGVSTPKTTENPIAIGDNPNSDEEGPSSDITMEVMIPLCHNSLFSNLILLLYVFISCSLFLIFYHRGTLKAEREERRRVGDIRKLRSDEQNHVEKLELLKVERGFLAEQLKEVKSEFQERSRRASITEDELFDEIAKLEKKLDENRSDQSDKEGEIADLKEQLEKLERRKGGGKKRKLTAILEKRLAILYKNIDMHRKALTGMMDLSDEMQIKAEEVIHQLNDDPASVTVKRKVFAGKKNRTASFEVLFSYNGRLYFRNLDGNRAEVLIIGTKNSQDKDMEFLHDL